MKDWYAGVYKTKSVVIGIPAVDAFMIGEDDPDRGLASTSGCSPRTRPRTNTSLTTSARSTRTERRRRRRTARRSRSRRRPPRTDAAEIARLRTVEKESKDKALAAYLTLVEDNVDRPGAADADPQPRPGEHEGDDGDGEGARRQGRLDRSAGALRAGHHGGPAGGVRHDRLRRSRREGRGLRAGEAALRASTEAHAKRPAPPVQAD